MDNGLGMTTDERIQKFMLREMDASLLREMDSLIAERIMGWYGIATWTTGDSNELLGYSHQAGGLTKVPYYSTDIAAAFLVVRTLTGSPECSFFLNKWKATFDEPAFWSVGFRFCEGATEAPRQFEAIDPDSPARAIAKAALRLSFR